MSMFMSGFFKDRLIISRSSNLLMSGYPGLAETDLVHANSYIE